MKYPDGTLTSFRARRNYRTFNFQRTINKVNQSFLAQRAEMTTEDYQAPFIIVNDLLDKYYEDYDSMLDFLAWMSSKDIELILVKEFLGAVVPKLSKIRYFSYIDYYKELQQSI